MVYYRNTGNNTKFSSHIYYLRVARMKTLSECNLVIILDYYSNFGKDLKISQQKNNKYFRAVIILCKIDGDFLSKILKRNTMEQSEPIQWNT
eukprot:snap_masked-scaffold_14-processed-gene-8.20-mRNA-1 protein AED:1.00 eAED:1.00 QI:0/0/0/0/1/1/2/0/91